MPSTSKAQQKFMGLVHAYKKGEVKGSEVSQAIKKAAKSMKKSSTKKYASTKHKGLPNKVKQEGFGGDLKGEDKKKFEFNKTKENLLIESKFESVLKTVISEVVFRSK